MHKMLPQEQDEPEATGMRISDIAYLGPPWLDEERLATTLRSDCSLVVPEQTPALQVARRVDAERKHVVFVVDSREGITGVVVVAWVIEQYRKVRGIKARRLADLVEIVSSDPSERKRSFRHEWLNTARPQLFWCDPGKHYTGDRPCPAHASQT